jgi:hypothetical protein
MAASRSRIRYRGNGAPSRKQQFGPYLRDQVNGFRTQEEKVVTDDYGYMVDPKWGVDIDETLDGGPRR